MFQRPDFWMRSGLAFMSQQARGERGVPCPPKRSEGGGAYPRMGKDVGHASLCLPYD